MIVSGKKKINIAAWTNTSKYQFYDTKLYVLIIFIPSEYIH